MNKHIAFVFFLLLSCFWLQAQDQSVGVFVKSDEAYDGYTFFSPIYYENAYLIDNCGFLVNEWERDFEPGLTGYFLENGLMLRCNDSSGNFPQASAGGLMELVDWDNNVVWSYNFTESGVYNQHHDMAYMPNGNILIIGWEVITESEQIAMGKDVSNSGGDLWGEFIWEVKPIGTDDIEIVWEWHLKDHFVQDYDSSKPNYGIVKDNVGLVDINYFGPGWWSHRDWWHCNAIDYHAGKDQILLNSRNNNELWIIDHSTTTAEAATDSGGNSGKGGNLLFRWGNPIAYDYGTEADLKMYGSHGHYWIPEGLPNAGNILFFNNGDARPEGYYSTVEMITPAENADGSYVFNSNGFYEPVNSTLVYEAPVPFDFVSFYLSNAQQLANGNVLINEGGPGRLFEINPQKEIVWEYISPVRSNGPTTQGSFASGNSIFRAYKFPSDYPGFADRELIPGELLEGDSDFVFDCTTSLEPINNQLDIHFYFDMTARRLVVDNKNRDDLSFMILNAQGVQVANYKRSIGSFSISLDDLTPGAYFVRVQNDKGHNTVKKILIH